MNLVLRSAVAAAVPGGPGGHGGEWAYQHAPAPHKVSLTVFAHNGSAGILGQTFVAHL